jgi:tetratricopeptide (TPR) repeat protein
VRESRESLKKVIEGASAPQIRGIAMRFLISSLYMDAVTDRDSRDESEWQTEERECREYANLALRECSEEGWGLAVRFIARTALGVLDYYSDDTAIARIHLSDAEKLYARDRKLCELGTSVHVGFALFTLGQILQLSGDSERASAYYKRALEKVDETLRIAVLCFLSSALLEGNKNREAQSIAAKGLRELGPNGARALKDDLQCNLADALARLGDAKGARTLLTEVVDVGVVESKREWARNALEVLGVGRRTV